MQKERNYLKERFQKIFSGSATRDEKEQAARWLSRLDVSEKELSAEDIEAHRLELQKKFQEQFIHPAPVKRTFRLYRIPAVAAALLVLTAGAFFFISKTLNKKEVIFTEAFTKTGTLKIITLSDGTKITLNNASILKFPQSFTGSDKREVYLDGEAFFEVTHQKEHPFIVHTGKLKINVLGTSFNVKSYKEEKVIRVSVATGKVGVLAGKKGSKTYLLLPGDHLDYNRINEDIRQSKVDPREINAWETGTFVFHNETLENISHELERWYGVQITFKRDSLRKKRFNLKQKNDRLENVMQTLAFAGGIHYQVEGKQVLIW